MVKAPDLSSRYYEPAGAMTFWLDSDTAACEEKSAWPLVTISGALRGVQVRKRCHAMASPSILPPALIFF